MTEQKFTPFRERLPELLAHPECHILMLHLRYPEEWPLPCCLDEYVAGLDDNVRPLAEFILENVDDSRFSDCVDALESATLKVEAEGAVTWMM